MEESKSSLSRLSSAWKQIARRLLVIGENRLELLAVEVQEERERLLCVMLMALGMAALGLLACMTFTAAIVIFLWDHSHVAALLTLTGFYGAAAGYLRWRMIRRQRNWETLPATVDQFKKDRACLENFFQ